MKCIVSEDVVLSRPLDGPLSAHIAGFAKWVRDEGTARFCFPTSAAHLWAPTPCRLRT